MNAAPSAGDRPVRVAVVTNIPAPYRLPVYAALAAQPGIALRVIFCSGREPDREWDLAAFDFEHRFLRQRFLTIAGRFIHANPDVWAALQDWQPDVVVTTGFNPTHLIAYAWARRHGAPHVAMTDGTAQSETQLSALHRAVRRHVYARTAAFVGASEGSFELYRQYGVRVSSMFKSHLCADNAAFASAAVGERDVDLMFCGRFVAGKQPVFALQVACATARRLGRPLRMLFVGSGELDDTLRQAASRCADLVHAEFAGFARQQALPALYARARVLLFPTLGDTWGVVANEACAAGVPVITCPGAGVAGELVREGETGRVIELDVTRWATAAAELLAGEASRERMARRATQIVAPYTHENAALGLAAAVRHALRGRRGPWQLEPHASAIVPQRSQPRVVIVQRRMTRYRVPLFETMRTRLHEQGIALTVVRGDPTAEERTRADDGHLEWARHVPCRYWFGGRLCWQPAWSAIRDADLAIVTQENKLLLNLLLMTRRQRVPMAFWGHGRNFQARSSDGPSEWFKRRLLRRADWWFAYTALSRDLVVAAGYPAARVTVLDNAIDSDALRADLAPLWHTPDELLRRELGLGPGPVVLLLASLHAAKRVEFQLEVARRARESLPDLQLLVVGDGPLRERVAALAREHTWVRWLGARHGRDKAACLRVSQLLLQTHGVGLVAVDSLVAGVPILTVRGAGHAPEIAYLRDGHNSVVLERADAAQCAAELVALLRDEARLARLAHQCLLDGERFGIAPMAERFCDGIVRALRGVPGPAAPVAARSSGALA